MFLNAALAGFFFLVGVWLYFYIDRIPVARLVNGQHFVAKPGTTLVIGGLGAGPLLSVNLRSGGRLQLSVENGAKVVAPSSEQLAAAADAQSFGGVVGRTILDLYKPGTGNAGLDFELRGAGRMQVELVPAPLENGRSGFHIMPRGGALVAHVLMTQGNDGSAGEMTLMAAGRATQWDEAIIEIPDGETAAVLADDPASGGKRSTVIELPVYSTSNPVISGTLPAASVGVGDAEAGNFEDVLCGADSNQKRFKPLIFPAVGPVGCQPGKIDISALDPFGEISLDARGTAFVVKDGKTEYWQALSLFIANPLVASALKGAIVAPFLLWAGFAFKALWNALRRRWAK